VKLALGAALLAAAAAIAARTPAERLPAAGGTERLAQIVIDGTINPAVGDFVRTAIARAAAEGAPALVVQLDTPGGLLTSAQQIVKDLLGAPVPVLVWVAPSGASAGSAGVFITLAAHVAAMAPGTTIGAAHPVGGGGEEIGGKVGEKIENFTAAFSEAIARRRGRNVAWAARAVRHSVSATADEAARQNVVDFVAADLDELVRRAEGRTVDVAGTPRKLTFARLARDAGGHVRVDEYEMRLAQRLLNRIAHPQIAMLLMTAGFLGLYVEFTHPGVVFPGVAGAICLLLGLAALHMLPINTTGLVLLLLGVALLVAEAFLPTFGILGVGGLVAFALGGLFLFEAGSGLQLSRTLVLGTAGTVGAVMLVIATLVARSQWRRPAMGAEGMIGAVGVVKRRLAPEGTVLVHGEYWTAESGGEAVDEGERVQVTAVDGLRLRVRRRS
jgi:membrane-bound serine protease (ClpP class)